MEDHKVDWTKNPLLFLIAKLTISDMFPYFLVKQREIIKKN